MRMKLNYIVIPLITIVVMLLGSWWSKQGMGWYSTLTKPKLTPPRHIFKWVWSVLYALITISALLFWNQIEHTATFWVVISLFAANALCNLAWSYFFFCKHYIGYALVDTLILISITANSMLLMVQHHPLAALLLAPYLSWLCFACYLNTLLYFKN